MGAHAAAVLLQQQYEKATAPQRKEAEAHTARQAQQLAEKRAAAEAAAFAKAASLIGVTTPPPAAPTELQTNAANNDGMEDVEEDDGEDDEPGQEMMPAGVLGQGPLKATDLQDLLLQEIAKPAAKTIAVGKAPLAVATLYRILLAHLPKRWKKDSNEMTGGKNNAGALRWHEDNFRNELFFRVPRLPLSAKPSPIYHSITGLNFYVLRWELILPGVVIQCPSAGCTGNLVHSRQEFTKNRKAVPLFRMDGRIDWTIQMQYRCNHQGCQHQKKPLGASAPELMMQLPKELRDMYPVDPRYVQSGCHLTLSMTRWLRSTTITYLSAEMFSKFINEMLGMGYVDEVSSFIALWSKNKGDNDTVPPYLQQYERSCAFPPTGTDLRKWMTKADTSPLTDTGVSDYERHRREIISVPVKLAFAFDHCFATAKCYKTADIKQTFNITNETGQVVLSIATEKTKTSEYAHAVEQMIRRPAFQPKIYYSDIFPSGDAFWKMMLGVGVLGRLGLFHFFQRIVRTLRDNHEYSVPAIRDLKQCIYMYDSEDLALLIKALKEGAMGNRNRKYNESEINEMMYTKKWKDRYNQYLKKKDLSSRDHRPKIECLSASNLDNLLSRMDKSGFVNFVCDTI